jgi:large subunit ribosomal protein L29
MKDSAKVKDLRSKDAAALAKELVELQRAHFGLRMQKGTQQLSNTSQLQRVRRDIARVKTLQRQMQTKAGA